MAFTVETGTGSSSSNSYVATSYADTYHEDRGNSAWASANDANKEAALIRAFDYLNTLRYRGVRYASDQAGAFPRKNLIDDDSALLNSTAIPEQLKRAQCEAALLELATPYCLRPATTREGFLVRSKIDIIEKEYSRNAPSGTDTSRIRNMLKGLLAGSPGRIELVRF